MSYLRLRVWVVGLVLLIPASLARADRAADLVRIHIEAIGGEERIKALAALRATGEVVAAGKKMRFTLIAARPDKVRLETENGGRSLVQATDGRNPPWEFDTGHWPPQYRNMAATVAKTFAADAEFDDPLVGGERRGFVIEFAGEVEVEGKKLLRLLVTHQMTETFALLLDPDTYFVVRRLEDRKNAFAGMSHIVTQYGDFRPVAGVLLPHRIAMAIDGRAVQETRIDTIDANPEIAPDTFTRPGSSK
jgi:hypothetical protein